MEKDLIFFGANGLTNTSANTIANYAKEAYEKIEKTLNSIKFYDTYISFINSDEKQVGNGLTVSQVNEISSLLEEMASYKSLIAWLREAIKAREALIKEVSTMTLTNYCELVGIEYPKVALERPTKDRVLTEAEYFGSLSIAERNRYYNLETIVSTIGKFIHENSPMSIAREELATIIKSPYSVSNTGMDTIVTKKVSTVDYDTVNKVFFELQQKHRDYQKELNHIKYECEKAISDSEIAANKKYEDEYAAYQLEVTKISNEVENISNKFTSYRAEKLKEIKDLKIIIPSSLQDVFTRVQNLGK